MNTAMTLLVLLLVPSLVLGGRHNSNIAPVFMLDDNHAMIIYDKGTHINGTPRTHPPPFTLHPNRGDELCVDLLILADHTVYEHFLHLHRYSHSAMKALTAYMNVLALEVHRLVSEQIRPSGRRMIVNPVGFYIAQDSSGSPWANARETRETHQLSSSSVLQTVLDWMTINRRRLPPHDHAVTMTRHELVGVRGEKNVEGVAWPQSICGNFSLSVVEDIGLARTAWSIVHELAHSLGADHGGIDGHAICNFEAFDEREDGYLADAFEEELASINPRLARSVNNAQPYRSYVMNKCVIEHIDEHLASPFAKCVHGTRADWEGSLTANGLPISALPGIAINARQQCQILFGEEYTVCRHQRWFSRHMCGRLYCTRHVDVARRGGNCISQWSYMPALYGTHCGAGRWCHQGRCVAHHINHAYSHCAPSHRDAGYCSAALNLRRSLCTSHKFARHCCHLCRSPKRKRRRDLVGKRYFHAIHDRVLA